MDNWSNDPRRFLLMRLKLRPGIQFSHDDGAVQVSLPGILDPAPLPLWQYRIMLGLDGEDQFIGVVKNVTDRHGRDFDAADVWRLLYWLIEKDLLEDTYRLPTQENHPAIMPNLGGHTLMKSASRSWLHIPLQLLAVLAMAVGVVCATYFSAPLLISHWETRPSGADPLEEVSRLAEKIKATRVPSLAAAKEVNLAGAMTPSLTEPISSRETAELPSPVSPAAAKLLEYRREIEACQIRRDTHYLLNDEEGYQREVERIAELAKEIGNLSPSLDS